MIDALTIQMLENTSPDFVLARVRKEEQLGIDAYTISGPWGSPRDVVVLCGYSKCSRGFWSHKGTRRYCSDLCRIKAFYGRKRSA